MIRDGFSYRINAEVLFTSEEVKNMMKCSAEHYDYKCKDAGKLGGFLYGLNNRFAVRLSDGEFSNVPALVEHRNVDLLCKILEGPSADKDLYWKMRELLIDLNKESLRLNRPDIFKKEYPNETA